MVGLKLVLAMVALLWGWRSGAWVAALLLSSGGLLMLLSFAALPRINRDDGPGYGTYPLLRAWLREWLAFERVFSWQQPFAQARYPDHLPIGSGRRGVLLLHGFTCNRGVWNRWLARLREQGTPCLALTLEPAFGAIDDYAAQIEAGLRTLEALGGPPPLIVAHSMGGLAARAWRRRYVATASSRVARIMTLGSPHGGTLVARFSPTVNGQQMRRGSAWLAALAEHEGPQIGTQFSCYFSRHDQVVCPALTAVLPGSQAIELAGCGHLSLLDEPSVFADLQQWLDGKIN